jgi:hypothetical protein
MLVMNKKQKILTAVALAAFGAIIFFNYGTIWYERSYWNSYYTWIPLEPGEPEQSAYAGLKLGPATWTHYPGRFRIGDPGINDVRTPLFVLAVFYVGLFFIFGDEKKI